jgi:DNA-binding GntR family transcriptional regulator
VARIYQFGNPLSDRQDAPRLIADALREAIIHGRLAPGEALRQEQLAAHFNVSRIPLREALRGLESEGWIEFLPNRGARVGRLCAAEVAEIYEIRATLECMALRLAVPNHTPDSWKEVASALRAARLEAQRTRYVQRNRAFHFALYRPAQRPHLLQLIESLHNRGERYLRLKLEIPACKRGSDDEHQRIYRACRRGEIDRAAGILAAHLQETGSMLAEQLRLQAPLPAGSAAAP